MTNFSISIIALIIVFAAVDTAGADLVVELGSAEVGVLPGGGTTTASLGVVFHNPTQDPVPISGYSLFFDIDPAGMGLPAGVSFADPAATYLAGQGVEPLTGAANPGTINHSPAAGDLGLGQIQLFNGSIAPGASFEMLRVNLLIDQQDVVLGDYAVLLNDEGQNSIDALSDDGLSNVPQAFTVTPGSLRLVAIPEPSAAMYLLLMALLATRYVKKSRAPA